MDRSFSTYLDAVRFLAACLVYLWHSNKPAIIARQVPFSDYGHSAVIVFFVLSGFVIAYVVDTKERGVRDYAASRLSRIYSVAIPALLLTPVLDAAGRALAPGLYGDFPFDQFLVRTLASLLLLNEVWFVSITAFSNAPYWSIAYEGWYYVLFGVISFAPRRLRAALCLALACALGPKIVLLLPIWMAGVALYHWQWPRSLSRFASGCLLVASLVAIVAFHAYSISAQLSLAVKAWTGDWLHHELAYSKFFLGDWLLGLLVFANFVAMRNLAPLWSRSFAAIEGPVRALAGYTFTLYLLHQPVLMFWAAVLRGDPGGWLAWGLVTALTAVTIWLIGRWTEQRRQTLRLAVSRLLMSNTKPALEGP